MFYRELDPTFFLELYLYFYTRLSSREFVPYDTRQRPSVGWPGGVAGCSRCSRAKKNVLPDLEPSV